MPHFISRELSWLDFNARVLAEAQKRENLPLDRLKFLAITASNLDEFFMVRAAYLQVKSKDGNEPDDAGLTAQEQLAQVLERTRSFQLEQAACLQEILEELREAGILICRMADLSETQLAYARELFADEISPVVTPLAVDPSRPFPFLANQSLNIAMRLRNQEGENVYAVVQVPSILPRFIPLPEGPARCFVPLEELIAYHLPQICDLHEILAYGFFRITRSADFDVDDDTDNLLEEMKRTLKKRKRSKPIRLELSENFDEKIYDFLRGMFNIGRRFVFQLPGWLDISAFSKIAALKGFDNLRPKPLIPAPAADFYGCEDIFAAIREQDRMLHHPYESFDPVVDFISAAAADPQVLAIKQTLYRVSGRSRVVTALEEAAENGKQVTVLVELKARFDEENNIKWASRMERAGCHVIYGLTGLKTHCKITMVVRRETDGIRRYIHLSTGNYNDVTARLYTDIGMFTCRPAFGADASALFNHLTGFSKPPEYHKLVVAPENMKQFFLDKINQEIENAQKQLPCGISLKANSLLDGQIVRRLYEASGAGVPIRLLVRGICSLLPGQKGLSDNIRVRSVLGQLLEHSRVYIFENAGAPLVYMGSADLMPRNLDRRVELLFPVEDPALIQRLQEMLRLMWRDNVGAWELGPDGLYRRVKVKGKALNSQQELARLAREQTNKGKR
jgi:polyphosphate kinase